jgi:hypothetical protein
MAYKKVIQKIFYEDDKILIVKSHQLNKTACKQYTKRTTSKSEAMDMYERNTQTAEL